MDFNQFFPAGKPVAFFIEPIIRSGALQGWFVLQWSLNKFNALFAGSKELGPSRETFLVNRSGFMLTALQDACPGSNLSDTLKASD